MPTQISTASIDGAGVLHAGAGCRQFTPSAAFRKTTVYRSPSGRTDCLRTSNKSQAKGLHQTVLQGFGS